MSKIILKTDKNETEANDILDKRWAGDYHLLCSVYTGHEVKLQVQGTNGVWNDASVQTSTGALPIKLTAVGAVLPIELVRDFKYRLVTATAGAEVEIAKKHPHGV